jgi:hypothetical protein
MFFWAVMPRSPVEVQRHFGEAHHFHLQCRSKALIIAGFLLGLFFDPEDGDIMFFRQVGLPPNHTGLQSRRPHSSQSQLSEPGL